MQPTLTMGRSVFLWTKFFFFFLSNTVIACCLPRYNIGLAAMENLLQARWLYRLLTRET